MIIKLRTGSVRYGMPFVSKLEMITLFDVIILLGDATFIVRNKNPTKKGRIFER